MKQPAFSFIVFLFTSLLIFSSCSSRQKDGGPCSYESFDEEFQVSHIDTLDSGVPLIWFASVKDASFKIDLSAPKLNKLNNNLEVDRRYTPTDRYKIRGERITDGTCTPLNIISITPKITN